MHSHGLLITVFCGDRLHGAGTTPSHFEVLKIEPLLFEEISARTGGPGSGPYGAKDQADGKRIQDEGGPGVALALFQFVAVGGLKMKGVPCVVERYALAGGRDSGCTRVASQRELKNTVKEHVNGVALSAVLERPEAVERPLVKGVGCKLSRLQGWVFAFNVRASGCRACRSLSLCAYAYGYIEVSWSLSLLIALNERNWTDSIA